MTALTRDVAQSLFPDITPDRPCGPLRGSVFVGTNAELIAAYAPYYLTGSVLDPTYGDGKWWTKFTPQPFTYHDLHKVDGVDFRHLPHPDRSFDTVAFDPPYVAEGGTASTEVVHRFRGRYGIDDSIAYGHEDDLAELILAGLAESARVARRWVLVKCMEFVSSRQFHDMPHTIRTEALGMGLRVHDVIVHHTGAGPGGHNIFEPLRARRHHSYLLVFQVQPAPAEVPA